MNFKYYNPNIDSIVDKEALFTRLGKLRQHADRPMVGAIRMFKDGELIQNLKTNLVVALGRQYVAQRIFATAHASETEVYASTSSGVNIWDWTISHFGLGSGGSVVVGSYVNLLGPDVCDQDLYQAVALSGNPPDPIYLTTPGDTLKNISKVAYAVKPIKPNGTIDIIKATDVDCPGLSQYSYVRVVCSKYPGEPNYLTSDDDYININEAALYYSNGSSKVRMFSHICFPPKYIEKKAELVIEWYILC